MTPSNEPSRVAPRIIRMNRTTYGKVAVKYTTCKTSSASMNLHDYANLVILLHGKTINNNNNSNNNNNNNNTRPKSLKIMRLSYFKTSKKKII